MDSPSVKVLKETTNSVSMEVVLAEASTPKRPNLDTSDAKSPVVTVHDIERKLESAAERRRSFTQDRQTSLAAKLGKIEDVLAKKAALNAEFVQNTKDALEQKIEAVGENREAYLNQLKEKVKERLDRIQELQQSKENDELEQTKHMRATFDEKMTHASNLRDLNMQKLVKRLQAHEEAVSQVNASHKEQLEQLREKINQQLAKAEERREAELQRIISAAKEEEKKVEMVRQKKEALSAANPSGDGATDMEQN